MQGRTRRRSVPFAFSGWGEPFDKLRANDLDIGEVDVEVDTGAGDDDESSGEKGEASGENGEAGGEKAESSGEKGESGGEKAESSVEKAESSGEKTESSGEKAELSGGKGELSGEEGEPGAGPEKEDEPKIEPKFEPVEFVRGVLGEEPYGKQVEILEAVHRHRRVSVVDCNGSGKDWTAARVVLWWVNAFRPAKVIVTGPTDAAGERDRVAGDAVGLRLGARGQAEGEDVQDVALRGGRGDVRAGFRDGLAV